MSVNAVNQTDGSLLRVAGGTLFADNPIGSIIPYGGATAPSGWFICNGQAISRTQYADLFGVLGTSFGSGDGSTTFNIPDLRGEFIRGAGTNSHTNQGNGGTVGEHQDATAVPAISARYNGTDIIAEISSPKDETGNVRSSVVNPDSEYNKRSNTVYTAFSATAVDTTGYQECAVRPTNTSVNYIIKAKHVGAPADFVDAIDDAVDEAVADLKTVSTMTVTKQGNYINGTNFFGSKVGKVAMIEINGDTGASIPWAQIVVVGKTTGCTTGIIELNCVADMLEMTTGYDLGGNAIIKYIPPYCRAWIDAAGNINVYMANPGAADTSYTKNLFIGGSYII